MDYRDARKLHNGDEVIVKKTRTGRRNVSAVVMRIRDFKQTRQVEVEVVVHGALDVYGHREVT